MSTTPATPTTPGPYSGTSLPATTPDTQTQGPPGTFTVPCKFPTPPRPRVLPATTPAARPPVLAEDFTDAQLQAAIDAAFEVQSNFTSTLVTGQMYGSPKWTQDRPNRLAIARAFLAALPRPEADPYARLKAYAKAGARIRCWSVANNSWREWTVNEPWEWHLPVNNYEVHPDDLHLCPEYAPKAEPTESQQAWTLPAPPAGRRWHREDWTADMLPEGCRPLLKDEPWLYGDEILRCNEWQVAGQHEDDAIGAPTTKYKCHCRTRRPLPAAEPPEAKPADPMPCPALDSLPNTAAKVLAEVVAKAANAKAFEEFQEELKAVWEPKPAAEGPAWIPHDGKGCPLKDEEVEEWEYKARDGTVVCHPCRSPSSYPMGWNHTGSAIDFMEYRVTKPAPGHGPQAAKAEPATFVGPDGRTYNWHAPGDPCPCDPEAKVDVLLADNSLGAQDIRAGMVYWCLKPDPAYRVMGWRYADEPAQAQAAPTEAAEDEARQERIRMTVNEGLNKRCHELHDMLRHAEAKLAELQSSQPPAQPWTPRPGDVVRLKSGGHDMTVINPEEHDAVIVAWSSEGDAQVASFPAASLQPAKEEARP